MKQRNTGLHVGKYRKNRTFSSRLTETILPSALIFCALAGLLTTVTGLTANGESIPCAGVFILRPAVAPTDLLPTLATANGAIQVDRSMATNLPGVFAAGDCTGAPYQIAKAAGEGQVAALSACAYLDDPAHQTT